MSEVRGAVGGGVAIHTRAKAGAALAGGAKAVQPEPKPVAKAKLEGTAAATPDPKAPADPKRSADARRTFAAAEAGIGARINPLDPVPLKGDVEKIKETATGLIEGARSRLKAAAERLVHGTPEQREQANRTLDGLQEGDKITIGGKSGGAIKLPGGPVRIGLQQEMQVEMERKNGKLVLSETYGQDVIVDSKAGDLKASGGGKMKNEYTFDTADEARKGMEVLGRVRDRERRCEVRWLSEAERAQRQADYDYLEKHRTATEVTGNGAIEGAKKLGVKSPVDVETSGKGQRELTLRMEKGPPPVNELRSTGAIEVKTTPQLGGGRVSVGNGGATSRASVTEVQRSDGKDEIRVKLEQTSMDSKSGSDTEITFKKTGDATRDARLLELAKAGSLEELAKESGVEVKHETWRKDGSVLRPGIDIGIAEWEAEVDASTKRITSRS